MLKSKTGALIKKPGRERPKSLAELAAEARQELRDLGHTVTEPILFRTGQLKASFVPRRRPKAEQQDD